MGENPVSGEASPLAVKLSPCGWWERAVVVSRCIRRGRDGVQCRDNSKNDAHAGSRDKGNNQTKRRGASKKKKTGQGKGIGSCAV